MESFFTSSLTTFVFFLVIGSVIVYFILKYDKQQRNKMQTLLSQTRDVQPLFLSRAATTKLKAVKPNLSAESRRIIGKQLDALVAAYDKKEITLPEYCQRLNGLLAMVNNN